MNVLNIGGKVELGEWSNFISTPITKTVIIDIMSDYNGSPTGCNYIMDGHDMSFEDNKFNVTMLSDVFEHSPNPIKLLEEIIRVTSDYIFMIVPNMTKYYDRYRPLTQTEHIIEDYFNNVPLDDQTHIKEYTDLSVNYPSEELTFTWLRKFHSSNPIAYPYVHQHTFTLDSIENLIKWTEENMSVKLVKSKATDVSLFIILKVIK